MQATLRFTAFVAALAITLLPRAAAARPVASDARYPVIRAAGATPIAGRVVGAGPLASSGLSDTVMYGGTFWAADSARWEAIRGGTWTFESGVGSAFGPTGPNKPAGYHTLMEGWYGVDRTLSTFPWFRRSQTCVIAGSWSFWAGISQAEANGLCWSSGQGYGDNWNMFLEKTFSYPGTGNVTLSYQYAVDSEPGYDYTYALVDTSGTGAAADIVLATYDGAKSGTATLTLVRGTTLPRTARNIIIKFNATSDGGYSDEDGLYPTTCGHTALDNIRLTGAITDFSDFESGPNGWTQVIPTTGVGDYTNIVNRNTLPPQVMYCRCAVSDSVLVFFDTVGEHPLDQDNVAVSPWIDLKRGGDVGRPGKVILYDYYSQLALEDYVYPQWSVRYGPVACAGGTAPVSPWEDVYLIYPMYGTFCSAAEGSRGQLDVSSMVDLSAEQVQLAIGVLNLCSTEPMGPTCTGVTNTTPWFDNISLGVYGGAWAPYVYLLTSDILQDNFATDGTLNPASTGRLDVNRLKNASTPFPGAILGDTLVVSGDAGNTEVRLVFHVRPGPFTNPGALAARAARWTAEPGIGSGWYSARLDTAEQGGSKTMSKWMGCFHEADPGFRGTDRTPDPIDPSQLENEILPDHVLTAGSRIDYFLKARYIPPDPRNPSGTAWYLLPDTTGGNYLEVEILPSSMSADTTWNCTLYVDQHADRDWQGRALEQQGLTAYLGTGGGNAEGARYDRFDNQSPSMSALSFGRATGTNFGATLTQTSAYRSIAWHCAILTPGLTAEDANVLGPWLNLSGQGGHRFWASGENLAYAMSGSGKPSLTAFLQNTLGVLYTCSTIRSANCPSGTVLDSTYCLPLSAAAGSAFSTRFPASLRGNGCPEQRGFDLISVNPSVATARGQLNYVKAGADRNYASVTNIQTAGTDYKTVFDAFSVGQLRTNPGDPHNQSLCRNPTAAILRAADVLTWFATPSICGTGVGVSAVPDGGISQPPQYRTALGAAYPNPMSPATRISFVNGVEGGRVLLQVFDVTGRLVRTLVDAPLPAGPGEAVWDGRADAGTPVASGLYFYRMTSNGFVQARKLVVIR